MRWRTLVGGLAIVCYIAIYSMAAMIVGTDCVPDHWAARLAYYPVVGVIWIFPLRPVFRWMARDPDPGEYPFG